MNQLSYLVSISHATTATELHRLQLESQVDSDLSLKECREVAGAVSKRFTVLNHLAVGPQKPRWGTRGAAITHPVRIPAPTRAH